MIKSDDVPKLEALGLQPTEQEEGPRPKAAPAKFRIDTRGGGDRRKSPDRRQMIRFEDDRRKGDRRANGNPWDNRVNL
ncbi:hypothetical protein ACFPU0_01435 [Pseudomonas sp. GCM10022186]|uniref:hypothetical protein n=1 Tax=Pseudomonas sp. GCM10022186 TaxID=3252650 RepID=UPI00361809D2